MYVLKSFLWHREIAPRAKLQTGTGKTVDVSGFLLLPRSSYPRLTLARLTAREGRLIYRPESLEYRHVVCHLISRPGACGPPEVTASLNVCYPPCQIFQSRVSVRRVPSGLLSAFRRRHVRRRREEGSWPTPRATPRPPPRPPRGSRRTDPGALASTLSHAGAAARDRGARGARPHAAAARYQHPTYDCGVMPFARSC